MREAGEDAGAEELRERFFVLVQDNGPALSGYGTNTTKMELWQVDSWELYRSD